MAAEAPARSAFLAPRALHSIAPAKINLTLAITGRRADGYHLLESFVGFAGIGDRLRLEPHRPPGLTLSGPFAAGLDAGPDNLVLKAARLLQEQIPGLGLGHFHLVKHLPVASGIGGGSADAGAALRLLAKLNGLEANDPRLIEAAQRTGADVPVCLARRARMICGIGERLGPARKRLGLCAVLVNPGVHLATPAVFRALAYAPGQAASDRRPVGDMLLGCNDLEAPAIGLQPAIGLVLARLRASAGCSLARMSGSGATCFGLFENDGDARAAAVQIAAEQPGWWVRPTVIN